MSKLLPVTCLLALGLSTLACNNDDVQAVNPRKGQIDRPALESGITINIANNIGVVNLPFAVAVPEIEGDTGGTDTLESEMEGAVSLVVTSNNSGATADLVSGIIVDGDPASPGQWNWELNADRDEATMNFFNATVTGLTLKSSVTYDAALSIAENDYIEEEESFSFTVTVTGG